MDPITVSTGEMVMRLVVAAALGVLVGAQRSHIGKTAGMRTYALVALGSALFTMISSSFAFRYADLFEVDPLRVSSQILVGIGFLGAGVIFVQQRVVTGLTTAAGLWVVAGIGMASGLGMFEIATVVTVLTLFIFTGLWYVEARFIRAHRIVAEDDDPEFHDKRKNAHRVADED